MLLCCSFSDCSRCSPHTCGRLEGAATDSAHSPPLPPSITRTAGRSSHTSSRQRQGSSGGGGRRGQAAAAAEPRPYFWRVHQRMQAEGARAGGAGAAPAGLAGEEGWGAALPWRRLIYEQVRRVHDRMPASLEPRPAAASKSPSKTASRGIVLLLAPTRHHITTL